VAAVQPTTTGACLHVVAHRAGLAVRGQPFTPARPAAAQVGVPGKLVTLECVGGMLVQEDGVVIRGSQAQPLTTRENHQSPWNPAHPARQPGLQGMATR